MRTPTEFTGYFTLLQKSFQCGGSLPPQLGEETILFDGKVEGPSDRPEVSVTRA